MLDDAELDDAERRILADLEHHLASADPAFAARMGGHEVPAFPTVSVLCVLLFLAFPIVMVLFGWFGLMIAVDLFAVALAVVLFRRWRRR